MDGPIPCKAKAGGTRGEGCPGRRERLTGKAIAGRDVTAGRISLAGARIRATVMAVRRRPGGRSGSRGCRAFSAQLAAALPLPGSWLAASPPVVLFGREGQSNAEPDDRT